MSANTKAVIKYLQEVHGQDVTSSDVAEALGIARASVDGGFTRGIQPKGLGVRVEAEIELEDGTHKKVKFLKLTQEGLAFDPDAVEAPANVEAE
jgi:hypothetical protein